MPTHDPLLESEIDMAKLAKAAGFTKQKFIESRRLALIMAAGAQRPSPAEMAAASADIEMAADEVYGK